MIYPAFSENTDAGVVLYFDLDGTSREALKAELERTYYCYASMGEVIKDGKPYIALQIDDDNA